MVLSASPQSIHIDGPTKPLFKRLSQVRMLEWVTSQRKRVANKLISKPILGERYLH
jgi:hypothetical protein